MSDAKPSPVQPSIFGGTNIPIGSLRRKVDIQKRVTGATETDDQGGVSYGPANWTTVFPSVFVRDATRTFGAIQAGGELLNAIRHDITLRYRKGVLGGMRLLPADGGRALYVQSVIDEGGYHRWLDLTCSEVEP